MYNIYNIYIFSILFTQRNHVKETGFFTFSPTSHLMIKTLSIGRMDNFLRRFSRMAILVQMLIFRDKTQKPRAISY